MRNLYFRACSLVVVGAVEASFSGVVDIDEGVSEDMGEFDGAEASR
jgi:hypothetical protein